MSAKQKVVIIGPEEKFITPWVKAFREKAPDFEVEVYPEDTQRQETEFILTFFPPENVFEKYPNLKVIASLGAGVRHITKQKNLPENVTITKANDPLHKSDMAFFTLGLVLNYTKGLMQYTQQKAEKKWQPQGYLRPQNTTVGIMGLGAIGQEIGKLFVKNSFKVTGWARSKKQLAGIQSFHGEDQKEAFLKTAQILICVLPLTRETEGILNAELFQKLPKKAYLINIGRGKELVEEDLEPAIANGQLSGAALDVFREEPLPREHSFWKNNKIMITPHTAGVTDPYSMLDTILKNYHAMKNNEKLVDVIDPSKGY